jgi:hypothetical protein
MNEESTMKHPVDAANIAPEPMTFVHAGPVLLSTEEAIRSLEQYLWRRRSEDVVLVHGGRSELHAVAEGSGVLEIEIDAPNVERLDEDRETADMAVEIGASSVEYAIDRPALTRPGGAVISELTASEADDLAARATLGERIGSKLRAAASAVRAGVGFARIGGPRALLRDRATVVYPDPAVTIGFPSPGLLMPDSPAQAVHAAHGGPAPHVARPPDPAPCQWQVRRLVSRRSRGHVVPLRA